MNSWRLWILGKIGATLDPKSFVIATYALCGFANLSSVAMQVGGIGALAPTRKSDLARLGLKAVAAGTHGEFHVGLYRGDAVMSVGVILGSGLGSFADTLENRVEKPYSDIPGWPASTVGGHAGKLVGRRRAGRYRRDRGCRPRASVRGLHGAAGRVSDSRAGVARRDAVW